MVEAAIE